LRAVGVPASVSGAGPTVLALPVSGELPTVVDAAGFTQYRLGVARDGAAVVAHDGGNVVE
jgi:homoserine kinase